MAEETVAEESMTEETVTEESVTEETVMEEIKTEDSADEESMNTNAMLGEALTGETAEYSTNEVNTTEDAMRKDFAMKADMDKADMSKSGEEEKKMIDDGDAYNSKKLITGKVKGVAVNETLRGVEYVIVDETEKGLIIKVQKDANGLLEQNGFFEVYAAADVKDEMLKECAGNKDTVFNNPLEYIGNNMFSIEKTE